MDVAWQTAIAGKPRSYQVRKTGHKKARIAAGFFVKR